ncbi:MAG TPA: MoaD/ThiS family protein [Candidatus Thermoplasmatota archaeon]|nr:MoaD/ThiS family protein [Candidatus Thermoplasmatota archaeon]
MRVRVKMVRPFRDAVGKPEVDLDGAPPGVVDAILQLCGQYPGLREHLLEDGALSPYVNIYVNGTAVHVDEVHKVALRDGDELLFLLPLTGG